MNPGETRLGQNKVGPYSSFSGGESPFLDPHKHSSSLFHGLVKQVYLGLFSSLSNVRLGQNLVLVECVDSGRMPVFNRRQ